MLQKGGGGGGGGESKGGAEWCNNNWTGTPRYSRHHRFPVGHFSSLNWRGPRLGTLPCYPPPPFHAWPLGGEWGCEAALALLLASGTGCTWGSAGALGYGSGGHPETPAPLRDQALGTDETPPEGSCLFCGLQPPRFSLRTPPQASHHASIQASLTRTLTLHKLTSNLNQASPPSRHIHAPSSFHFSHFGKVQRASGQFQH